MGCNYFDQVQEKNTSDDVRQWPKGFCLFMHPAEGLLFAGCPSPWEIGDASKIGSAQGRTWFTTLINSLKQWLQLIMKLIHQL